ncbi:uncharacterized protein LOC102703988 [Oryza brachyantha]|uniref:uncharacterized protein LOC102703988 n=1 Tax=Oryza brachyantha TaxID=4533 RepID=UPI001ADCC9AA|nr:uncharacterized protein LOC102703988 [Oryza brachyantha]
MDDRDLDSAALWAAVDSAAAAQASRRERPLLPRPRCPEEDDHRGGEVLQPARPFKAPRHLATPPPSSPLQMMPQSSPDAATSPRLVVFDSPPPPACFAAHDPFPAVSVANFRKYQEAALSILDKSDYTSISGNPYIKKSGWRKISCFFNISFEIKDRSIEFDENRNVKRAEFLVRASMQGGRFSDGWGSCDRREKKLNKPNHDVPSTAETRAKNKACQDLVGIGNSRPG